MDVEIVDCIEDIAYCILKHQIVKWNKCNVIGGANNTYKHIFRGHDPPTAR